MDRNVDLRLRGVPDDGDGAAGRFFGQLPDQQPHHRSRLEAQFAYQPRVTHNLNDGHLDHFGMSSVAEGRHRLSLPLPRPLYGHPPADSIAPDPFMSRQHPQPERRFTAINAPERSRWETAADSAYAPRAPVVDRQMGMNQPRRQQPSPPSTRPSYISERQSGLPRNSSPPLPSSPSAQIHSRRNMSRLVPLSQQVHRHHPYQPPTAPSEEPKTPVHQTYRARDVTPPILNLSHAPPIANGIQLVSPRVLGDRFRQVFPYELFNAVQSKCFEPIHGTNDNVVVSAPTGSGKTCLLELAICKLVEDNPTDQFKIVYQAPTKSLCSERVRDWGRKFSILNLTCAELTGDTSQAEMRKVSNATIIVTTPEKWDSITRKWKDHLKLLQMVKLVLIDEIHILKDIRGATLEAVVSRMKSIGAAVRFVALSATVPNSQDIAVWLGRNPTSTHLPALRETFGEEFRPVKLQRHVYGFESTGNDFMFDKFLDKKLPDLISKHTHKKPMMIFCQTRKSCEATASMLAEWWTTLNLQDKPWPAPKNRSVAGHPDLNPLLHSGVAFHHAGLDVQDRHVVEQGFLKREIHVICCTSTLAVGVNLPCHLVIVKNTVGFQDGKPGEYSDLEIMQMLGRAGRPQFDDTAVAIILTHKDKLNRYKKMVSGQEILESTLHLNLIEHLNSEISLNTVNDLNSAKKWLNGTFLSVRLRQNPMHYQIGGIRHGQGADELLERVCERDIKLLLDSQLIAGEPRFRCTDYGEAMSRYMVQYETMALLLGIPEKASMSQILQVICQAAEFKDLRMKPSERSFLRNFNNGPFAKFPIKENVSTTAHKIFLVVQLQLGGAEIPSSKEYPRRQYLADKSMIFDRIQRLVRCVADCKAFDVDAVSTWNALTLARSLSAGYWEGMPLQLCQVPNIGPAAMQRLLENNIKNMEEFASLGGGDIERILSRNPPFGKKMADAVCKFPRLTLSAEITGKVSTAGEPVAVKVKARLGFANASIPYWNGRSVTVTVLAENSNGTLVDFWRGSIRRLEKGYEHCFRAELTGPEDELTCRIACDDMIGTVKSVSLQPDLPASAFPRPKPKDALQANAQPRKSTPKPSGFDDFDDDDLEDADLLLAVQEAEKATRHAEREQQHHLKDEFSDEFADIDKLPQTLAKVPQKKAEADDDAEQEMLPPMQMKNGRWMCNHKCRDGQSVAGGRTCKHKCCHEGLDKPRKLKPKKKTDEVGTAKPSATMGALELGDDSTLDKGKEGTDKKAVPAKKGVGRPRNTSKTLTSSVPPANPKYKLSGTISADSQEVEIVDLADVLDPVEYQDVAPTLYRNMHKLYASTKTREVEIPKFRLQTKLSTDTGHAELPSFLRNDNDGTKEPRTHVSPIELEADDPFAPVPEPSRSTSNVRFGPDEVFSPPSPKLPSAFSDDGALFGDGEDVADLEAGMMELDQHSPPESSLPPRCTDNFEDAFVDYDDDMEPDASGIQSPAEESHKRAAEAPINAELPRKRARVEDAAAASSGDVLAESAGVEAGGDAVNEVQRAPTPDWVRELGLGSELYHDLAPYVEFVD